MKIASPSIIINLYTMLYQIASYDIISNYNIWQSPYFSFLKFGNNDIPFITQQMQTISYNSTNVMM